MVADLLENCGPGLKKCGLSLWGHSQGSKKDQKKNCCFLFPLMNFQNWFVVFYFRWFFQRIQRNEFNESTNKIFVDFHRNLSVEFVDEFSNQYLFVDFVFQINEFNEISIFFNENESTKKYFQQKNIFLEPWSQPNWESF